MSVSTTPHIAWVRQLHRNGCCVASVAMVAGKTYQEVRGMLAWPVEERGAHEDIVCELLIELGFAYQLRYPYDRLSWTGKRYGVQCHRREVWPPEPSADVHLACVDVPQGAHCVVWPRHVTVLDPDRPGTYTLSDYSRLNWVIALFATSTH